MDIWIASILPVEFLDILPAISLIIIGLIVETKYVGRIAIFANAVALTTFFYKFDNLDSWLVWYINLLTVAGIISLLSYVSGRGLRKEFYTIAGVFSSLISGIILLYGLNL